MSTNSNSNSNSNTNSYDLNRGILPPLSEAESQDVRRLNYDPLVAPHSTIHNDNSNNNNNSNTTSNHMYTYTAGEEGSRLAAAAKALGLQRSRIPRRPVRQSATTTATASHRSWQESATRVLHLLLLETGTEDARMRAIYSAHDHVHDDNGYGIATSSIRMAATTTMEEVMDELWRDVRDEKLRQPAVVDEDPEGRAVVAVVVVERRTTGGDLPAAVLGIIKGMVGPAILYLPHGFATAGFAVALPILLVTTILFLYSSTCLLQAWKTQNDQVNEILDNNNSNNSEASAVATESSELLDDSNNNNQPSQRRRVVVRLSYPELAYRALGDTGEALVKTGIALMQSGVCLTYLMFVPQNLHASCVHIWHWNGSSPILWLIVMVTVQVPLSWIRDIRKLTPTNAAANGCILYGLTVCLYYAVTTSLSGPSDASSWVNLWNHVSSLSPLAQDWSLFIGTSVLLFEGSITLLVPLQEAVDSDEDRAAFPAIYKRVILAIICFYAVFGLTCWMAFGDTVHTVLTTSLPDTNLSTTVQLAYSVAVLFTFPLQNFPALEIMTRTIQSIHPCASASRHKQQPRSGGKKTCWKSRNFLSACLVIGLALVAVGTMHSLDKVVSLMGSLLGCPIAFVFPPLIHSRLATDLTPTRLWGNRIVATLGVGAMFMASATTLLRWK